MKKTIALISGVAAAITLLSPGDAHAWGAGIHVAQGSFILDNLRLIGPAVAATLSSHPFDYIYGCISADIFIGKGYKRRDDHCHNWSVGYSVLAGASDEATKAYAYGYLTHLAADIIAHNYFIPNLLYATPATRGLGHLFWEFRADRFIRKKHWTLASKVISMHNKTNDDLIKRVMKRSRLRFGAKKMVFKRAVKLNDVMLYKEYVEKSYNSARLITRKDVALLNNYALNLIVETLLNGKKSLCMKYDPVGTDHTIYAKRRRRLDGLSPGIFKGDSLFPVPEEIINVRYVDQEAVRL